MSLTKYASFEVSEILEVKGSPVRRHASLDKLSDYDNYRTSDGYMYVRIRAISSRVNKNHDGWPSVELAGSPEIFERHAKQSSTGFTVEAADGDKKYGFATFVGKPIFVDHHNSDPKRARGVIVDAKLNVSSLDREAALDSYYSSSDLDKEHAPPTEVELLLEVDAKSFPTFAKAIESGELDGFSMGCDVERSKCSHCGNIATNPDEYCSHIVMKGAHHDFKTADGKRVARKSYENCYGISFFEISGVFEPADETALTKEVRANVHREAAGLPQFTAENPLPQSFHTTAPEEIDTLRQEQICPVCGSDMDGETCDACGYVKPPKGFDNPDLEKAKHIEQEMKENGEAEIEGDEASPTAENIGDQQEPPTEKQPGSYLQQTRNTQPTASVKSDMNWKPILHPKVAARINPNEKPLKTTSKPATNEPTQERVISDQTTPVTASMLTARRLMQAAQTNHTGDSMSTKTADGPTPPDASADKRVDVTGVGGVIEPSNDAASAADAQVDVTGTGSTGVSDVEAQSTQDLPAAGRDSDDSGFNKDKTTEDSGPTATFGDSDGTEKGVSDPVTGESLEGNQNKDSSARTALDAAPFPNDEIEGGSANQGTQPADPVGKAQNRVDVLDATTTPSNNSGPTTTWSGTDGTAVERQQDPITRELQPNNTDNAWTSHIVSSMKLADQEVELGLISKEQKYERIAEIEQQDPAEIRAQLDTLSRVKTAGLNKLAQARTAGVTSFPRAFGQRTAAPQGAFGKTFERIASGEESAEEQVVDETVLDSALFSR
jgi:hypothetical protein